MQTAPAGSAAAMAEGSSAVSETLATPGTAWAETLRLVDALDVLIVAGLCWVAIAFVREARARVALGGVALIGALYGLASLLSLRLTSSLLEGFIAVGALVLVVVFQDDLRRFFESLTLWFVRSATPRPGADVIEALGALCFSFAGQRVGALFVLPGREPLDRWLEGGHYLDGRMSEPLLRSLLDPATAGHDGAIVLRGGQIARFGVHLPLSTEWSQLGEGGTRHAAALGLAERSDAFCIVVSEERGQVSVAWRGRLTPVADPVALRRVVEKFLARSAQKRREPWLAARIEVARRRWREGVFATAVASGLWIVSVPGGAIDRSARVVPVVVDNLPEGYRVASVEPARVAVEFEGRTRDFLWAPADDFTVRVDGGEIDAGARTFAVAAAQVRHPPALRIVRMDPVQVRLRVEPL